MAEKPSFSLAIPATAVVSGSFLSGAMMGLSIVAVPVLLDTNTQSSHLLTQFIRLYHYGHQIMPSLGVVTFLLYGYTSLQLRASGKPWLHYIIAGAVTLTMVPFTWIVMVPTNDKLFHLDSQGRVDEGAADLTLVQGLLTRWAGLHVVRSLFPLAGAALGGYHILNTRIYGVL
ncbi:DUF1772-domain-containing protein [Lophiostoma macrostomum CBS 122681]|uniref:DUF1772-domain-containing protein n=1 Tax=Lophiostoma macrostomum CBS 122681 TaxID=1314788 RepID=A0A6A6SNC3_9PLEO|nr:DUF1772-domain-containing protein [Lophiostoma macrostomum CBS 122681]